MKLSTRTRYGIRSILELAENYGKGPVQLKKIAKDQEISIKYLEQLMAILKSAGIVKSTRGSKGGYILAKQPKEIKLSDCFNYLEGPIVTVECVENENYCTKTNDCITRQVWSEIQEAVISILESYTLQDLINKAKNCGPVHYQI